MRVKGKLDTVCTAKQSLPPTKRNPLTPPELDV